MLLCESEKHTVKVIKTVLSPQTLVHLSYTLHTENNSLNNRYTMHSIMPALCRMHTTFPALYIHVGPQNPVKGVHVKGGSPSNLTKAVMND